MRENRFQQPPSLPPLPIVIESINEQSDVEMGGAETSGEQNIRSFDAQEGGSRKVDAGPSTEMEFESEPCTFEGS